MGLERDLVLKALLEQLDQALPTTRVRCARRPPVSIELFLQRVEWLFFLIGVVCFQCVEQGRRGGGQLPELGLDAGGGLGQAFERAGGIAVGERGAGPHGGKNLHDVVFLIGPAGQGIHDAERPRGSWGQSITYLSAKGGRYVVHPVGQDRRQWFLMQAVVA